MAAQNSAKRTTHIKSRIDKMQQTSKCRLCRWSYRSHNKRMQQIGTEGVQGETQQGGQSDPLGNVQEI